MVHALSIWLLVAGFFGAGLFNAIGTPATQSEFARWGYPRWCSLFADGLEIMSYGDSAVKLIAELSALSP